MKTEYWTYEKIVQCFSCTQIKDTNKAYGLELEALYTISSNTWIELLTKKFNERVVPIDSAFEQVDAARKALGIWRKTKLWWI
jgi:hypothetical protein